MNLIELPFEDRNKEDWIEVKLPLGHKEIMAFLELNQTQDFDILSYEDLCIFSIFNDQGTNTYQVIYIRKPKTQK